MTQESSKTATYCIVFFVIMFGSIIGGITYAIYGEQKAAEEPIPNSLSIPIDCPDGTVTEFTYVYDSITKNTTEQVKCDKELWFFIKKEKNGKKELTSTKKDGTLK